MNATKRINIRTEKIEAIKALREFAYDTFGVTSGLVATKNFIDYLAVEQRSSDLVALKVALRKALQSGLTWDDIHTVENEVTLNW